MPSHGGTERWGVGCTVRLTVVCPADTAGRAAGGRVCALLLAPVAPSPIGSDRIWVL